MTDEETRETMTRVASDASMAACVAIGGCCPDFDHDPEQVEDLLIDALTKLIEEIDCAPDAAAGRAELLVALSTRKEGLA